MLIKVPTGEEREFCVLQAGMPKSGNYWLFTIVGELLREAGIPLPGYFEGTEVEKKAAQWSLTTHDQLHHNVIDISRKGCRMRVSSQYDEALDDVRSLTSRCTRAWTHSHFCPRTPSVLDEFSHAVYIVRDPRDVAISMSRFILTKYTRKNYPTPYEEPGVYLRQRLPRFMRVWGRHVAGYLAHARECGICILFYEQLRETPGKTIAGLADYLGLVLSNDQINAVVERSSFSSMRTANSGHVRAGSLYGWKDVLTDEQIQQSLSMRGGMLQLLGYPIDRDGESLPLLPAELKAAEVRSAMKISLQGRLTEAKLLFSEPPSPAYILRRARAAFEKRWG